MTREEEGADYLLCRVFRCVPDDLVQTWSQYREFQAWGDRHNKVR